MPRNYNAPQRRRQAQNTRDRLLASARRLFGQNGYTSTTIENIARDAGVAVQTVYATFGSKRTMLLALVDAMELEASAPEVRRRLEAAGNDRPKQLELLIRFNCRLFSQGLDILEILRSAGSADPDLLAVWKEGEDRRRQGETALVRAWDEAGAIGHLTQPEAIDILWSLTSPDLYRLLVQECGWTQSRFEEWLLSALKSELFGKDRTI